MDPHIANIASITAQNTDFRRVMFTGAKSQLVVMDIKSGEEVGEETHDHVEQTLFIVSGEASSTLDGKERRVTTGDVIVVPPGTQHNFVNSGQESLKLYTVYAPPNHIDGRVHKTMADAVADSEDEKFGHSVR